MKKLFTRKKQTKNFDGPGHRLGGSQGTSNPEDSRNAQSSGAAPRVGSLVDTKALKTPNMTSQVKQSTSKRPTDGTTSEVLFKCPALGDTISRTKAHWGDKFKQHIADIKAIDPVLSSILAIKSLNPPSVTDQCLSLLSVYLNNLIEFPDNEKYKSIRMGNPKFSEQVLSVEGALDLLQAAGFRIETSEGEVKEQYLVYNPDSKTNLKELVDSLVVIGGLELVLDRDFKVYKSKELQKSGGTRISDDFFEPTPQEIKLEQMQRTKEVEESKLLKTKKMRENEAAMVGKKRSLYTRIRVRLPNELVIQGTFSVHEKFKTLQDFIYDKIEIKSSYVLKSPPSRVYEKCDENKTFLELDLHPAVNLVLQTSSKIISLK